MATKQSMPGQLILLPIVVRHLIRDNLKIDINLPRLPTRTLFCHQINLHT